MASTSQPSKGRDRVLPTLDVFVQVLNTAKDTCGIPPAQVVFGSASVLLTMIRVRFPQPCDEDKLLTRVSVGHDGQQSGIRRPWAGLRGCVRSTLPEIEGETTGWTQPVRLQRDWRFDCVSRTSHALRQRSTD
jgi:hypothetical protein